MRVKIGGVKFFYSPCSLHLFDHISSLKIHRGGGLAKNLTKCLFSVKDHGHFMPNPLINIVYNLVNLQFFA